jgi:hypothetical protein
MELSSALQARKKTRKITLCLAGDTIKVSEEEGEQAPEARSSARRLWPSALHRGGSVPSSSRGMTSPGAEIGGLVGGDAKCQAAADSVGLNGVYKARLYTSSVTLITRFTLNGEPCRPVSNASESGGPGPLVATTFAALASCFAAGNCLTHGIDRTVEGVQQVGSDGAWTGTRANGTAAGDTCSNWTSATGTGRLGTFGNTDARWTEESRCPARKPRHAIALNSPSSACSPSARGKSPACRGTPRALPLASCPWARRPSVTAGKRANAWRKVVALPAASLHSCFRLKPGYVLPLRD